MHDQSALSTYTGALSPHSFTHATVRAIRAHKAEHTPAAGFGACNGGGSSPEPIQSMHDQSALSTYTGALSPHSFIHIAN